MPKAPTDIRSLARQWTHIAVQQLGGIAQHGVSESARVAACIALLERGWGRPPQTHTGEDGEGDIKITIRHIIQGAIAQPVLAIENTGRDTDAT